jgi:aerotaxis receptor
MRLNPSVTGLEYDYPDSEMLVSMTDKQGVITHCNAAFMRVSGYDMDELIGQAHNVVRHPDMPEETFKDMWRTIGFGRAWTALVKNRRKNGDHYWVKAHVTPLMNNGKPVGYLSVRTKPTREQVKEAEALYQLVIRERGTAQPSVRLHAGRVRYLGLRDLLGKSGRIHLTGRVAFALAIILPCCVMPSLLGLPAKIVPWLELGLGAVMATVMVMLIDRTVTRPLNDAIRFINNMSAGDLSHEIWSDRPDQVGMLMRGLHQANLNTRAFVNDVRFETEGIQRAIVGIAAGNGNLSTRTDSQAGNVERTTAAMSTLTQNVKQTADTAREVAQVSAETTSVAQQGGEAVGQVIQAMEGIQGSSRRMTEITQLIESIAFQTNILALNAAVEAARAGEQGRGFAVVASEVRSLAQRSSQAAKEIHELISNSVEQIGDGTRQVAAAGETMTRVVESVTQVTQLIQGITLATAEQSEDIADVNQSIGQIDSATQQNASLVEEAALAARSLQQQAETLVRAAQVFRVN